jgi:tripartite-type tricarboxylate transporter receptor subunit TctC
MGILRRTILHALAAVCISSPLCALAQVFPTQPIKLVVPNPPGGATDVLGRAIADKMSKSLGQPVIVENRPGAGTSIGSEFVARAPADGYTLLFAVSALTINPSLYPNLRFDPIKDFAPISLLGSVVHVLVVRESLPISSVGDLIRYAKANPKALSYASVGNGTSTHLEMELLKSEAGIEIAHIPFKGSSAAITDVLGGRVDLMFDALPTSGPHIQSRKLRALAVTSARRSPNLPNVPTVAESGLQNYDAAPWIGLLGPAGTPPAIVERLNREATAALKAPDVASAFAAQGIDVIGNSAQQFGQFIREDMAKWKRVVEKSGAKID